MKKLSELYHEQLSKYDKNKKIAQHMMIMDMVLNKKFGRRISLIEAGAGASRVLNLFERGNSFIQITAFKGCSLDRKTNLKRNAELHLILREKGLGITNVIGNDYCEWEDENTPVKETLVEEPGFFVSFSAKNPNVKINNKEELKELGLELCKKFEQWGYLYGDERVVQSIDSNGNVIKEMTRMGFNASDLGNMWSSIRGHKYSFKECIWPDGPIQAMIWTDL